MDNEEIIFVSIPFIAGQWSLLVAHPRVYCLQERVSIPFIAGQWSLPCLLLGQRLFF